VSVCRVGAVRPLLFISSRTVNLIVRECDVVLVDGVPLLDADLLRARAYCCVFWGRGRFERVRAHVSAGGSAKKRGGWIYETHQSAPPRAS